MIRHIVLLKPKPNTSEPILALDGALRTMLERHFPTVKNYGFGTNLAPPDRQQGFSHGFTMDFENREELRAYGEAPAHQPVKAMVSAACESTLAFDYELGPEIMPKPLAG
jgi:hypothetical protein